MSPVHTLGQMAADTTLVVVVHGVAQPAGSKRAFRNPKTDKIIVTDANKRSKPWKQEVAAAAAKVRDEMGAELMRGPLDLAVDFYVPRPKGHYGTGRNAGKLRDAAPDYPTTKPDATKLLRGVEDALTGVLWVDDAQVVRQVVTKNYGEARAVIRVRPMPEPNGQETLT